MFIIQGGNPLHGEITVQGAKNSVLPLLAATILIRGQTILHNCPRLRDVTTTLQILRHLGCRVKQEGTTIIVDASRVYRADVPLRYAEELRASILFAGSLLARTGQVQIAQPGGCDIGLRPIDIHLAAFANFGAELKNEPNALNLRAKQLSAVTHDLTFPSVGATENIMLAACNTDSETIINNAACEPEIVDLANFLRSAGMTIHGDGTPIITISGKVTAKYVEHTVIPDRIVAATYMAAAAATGGDVLLRGIDNHALNALITPFHAMGCQITMNADTLRTSRDRPLMAVPLIKTAPHPGFPTDAQSQLMAVLSIAAGTSIFVETLFENRYKHVDALVGMGADIKIDERTAVVQGVNELYGATVTAHDLRGGAALVIAGLIANGETRVENSHLIDRGYDGIEVVLKHLGANIVRE